MIRQTITIRGHHLGSLREDYLTPGITEAGLEGEYGEENIRETRKLFNLIKFGDVDIVVVDTLDDICNANCKKLNEQCKSEERAEYDGIVAAKYGFEIGKKYSSYEALSMLGVIEDW